MNEDGDRKCAEAAKNCSLLRQMALNLLKKEPTRKASEESKRWLPWIIAT
jgi:hypothetical protein